MDYGYLDRMAAEARAEASEKLARWLRARRAAGARRRPARAAGDGPAPPPPSLAARYSSGELQGGGLVRRSSRSIGALSRMFAETEDAEPAEPSTPATTDRSTDEESPES